MKLSSTNTLKSKVIISNLTDIMLNIIYDNYSAHNVVSDLFDSLLYHLSSFKKETI